MTDKVVTAKDKLVKAKVQLIFSQPFFATLLLSLPMIEDATIKTASTNGLEIKYNPEYIESLDIDAIKGLLCHVVLHITNFHHTRRNGRDSKNWNIATDYAINQMILDAGLILPEGGLIDKQYKDMAAEKIYSMLPAPQPEDKPGKDKQQPGQDPGKSGGVEDSPAKTQGEKEEIEARVKQNIVQAANAAKRAGKLTDSLKRLIEESLTPVVNWKEVLSRFVTDIAKNDYTFKRPNPRYLHTGFYLPSLHNEIPGKIIFMIDTSGSIDRNLLNQFSAELQDAANSIGSPVTVLYIDTKLQGIEELDPDSYTKLKPKGGGGTDFKPGFDWIEQTGEEAKAVVYFTDGYCSSYPKTPDMPVLWATYDNKNFAPPFGEVIPVDND